MHGPWVAPENRPSVISSTSLPRPAPLIAPVTASISRIPGPPAGPSYRITTASPALIAPAVTAAIASFSSSKTRATPYISAASNDALLTTAPSGAREPRSTVSPPVGWIGSAIAWMIRPSGSGGAIAASSSPRVRPLTVIVSPCSTPASSRAFITTGTPPIRSTSVIT